MLKKRDPHSREVEDSLNDGYAGHSPVGHYRGNPFGLHDVLGNVFEWCRDVRCDYSTDPRPGDGERILPGPQPHRIARGGAFNSSAVDCRVSTRCPESADSCNYAFGVRPAREIDP
jgi:formylglycine-generating enzyme required for sulfatase activity